MIEKQPTRREQQSARKRALICEKSLNLFRTYGYDKTTLADISQATGFSTGSLYNFFGNKESILLAIGQNMGEVLFDPSDMEAKARSPYEPLLEYLLSYSAHWEALHVDLVASIYSVFSKAYLAPEGKAFRTLASVNSLTDFIQAAQDAGTFDTSLSARDAAEYCFTIGRGLLYEWCLFGGSYSLVEKSRWFLPRILKTFIVT